MWYNTIPSFVPMDFHMYSTYYSGIEGHGPLISRRNKRYATNTTQLKSMPPIEQLEQIHCHVRMPSSRI
jgi:hypothetical protein